MTALGKKLCLRCGRTSKETVFYAPQLSVTLTVARNLSGRYCLLSKSAAREVDGAWLTERPTVDRDSGQITKIVAQVQFKDDPDPQPFILRTKNRICPHCLAENKLTQLPPYAGLAPAYLIGVCGVPGSGKTRLLRSLFTGKSVGIIRQALGGCRLETGLSDEAAALEANQLIKSDPLDLIKTIRVVDRRGKLAALLYLKDSPGELFDPKLFGSEAWERHMAPFAAAADAMLYVMDHNAIQAKGLTPEKRQEDPTPFLLELPQVPTAVVLTKMDKLTGHLPLYSQEGRLLLNKASPVFQATSPRREAITRRMSLDQQLIPDLVPYLSVSPLPQNPLVGYFTLSSGLDQDGNLFAYDKGYNQALPFLFLLNALGLSTFAGKEAGT